jgi:hypothetical protein
VLSYSVLKEKVLPTIGVMAAIAIFWIWPEVQAYQWADEQKVILEKNFQQIDLDCSKH